jgi:hypothetical protein
MSFWSIASVIAEGAMLHDCVEVVTLRKQIYGGLDNSEVVIGFDKKLQGRFHQHSQKIRAFSGLLFEK